MAEALAAARLGEGSSMTIVAYDGRTMAADKRAQTDGAHFTVTKVRRIRGCLVGASGDSNRARELVAWFERGASLTNDRPSKEVFDSVRMLVVDPKGRIWNYDSGPHATEFEDRFVAIGSGRDFALMAMHLGKSAFEAVRLTCELSIDCGNGIDALELVDGSHKPDLHVVGSDAPQWE
jgi:ATP-dependent protease HslVU (ClpYQ) peptidase subunit